MSIDKSLKNSGGLMGTRNVLKRVERIDQLIEEGRWHEGQSALGLPKVRIKHVVTSRKKKKIAEGEAGEEATAEESTTS